MFLTAFNVIGQYIPKSFGDGLNFTANDSTFSLKFGIRFQTLMQSNWNIREDKLNYIEDHTSNFLIRRSRLKFDGFAFSPKLKYKVELGLSNRDIAGGNNKEHSFSSRFILDAYLIWNFYQNFKLQIGQAKLPGNRERVISSANMQLVDRSLLNSRFNIDRDIGIQLKHHFKIGKQFLVNEIASFSQGEGRDITVGNLGGYDYTFRLEFLPFGKFKDKGDYIGGGIAYEEQPKLSVGATYDINDRAVRERGQLGSFIYNMDGTYAEKRLNTLFIDLMFKYKNLSIMAEYADKRAADNDARVYDNINKSIVVGSYYTGQGLNVSLGWMFPSRYELTGRYTRVVPTNDTKPLETEYTIGLSKYIVDHKLKVQTDLSYRENGMIGASLPNNGRDDILFWRLQIDIHF